jgi:hypothetical protein
MGWVNSQVSERVYVDLALGIRNDPCALLRCGRPKVAQKLQNINGFTEEGLQ